MKALRIALAVLGGLIVVLIIAAIILINTFDPNSLKDNMTAWVKERTGRDLEIAEDIELSLFPWFAVETGGIALSDDPAFGDRDFVRIDSLSARIRVFPLLRRQVEVGRIVVDGVELNLGVDASERGNWTTLLPEASPDSADAAPDAERPLERLAVEGVELRNATVRWHDATGELRYLVHDLELVTGGLEGDEPVDVSLSLAVDDLSSELTAALEIEAEAARAPVPAMRDATASVRVLDAAGTEQASATLRFDEALFEEGRVQSGPAELSAVLADPPIGQPGIEMNVSLAKADFDRASESLAIDGLALRAGALEAGGNFRGESLLSSPVLSGDVEIDSTIAALYETLGTAIPPELANVATETFAGSAAFDVGLMPLTVTIDRYSVAALGLEARGNATRNAAGDLTARVEVPPFRPSESLRALLAAHLPPGIDASFVQSLAMSANIALPVGGDRLDASDLSLTVNDARVAGQVALTGIADPARLQGQITATGIDNDLLAALLGDRLPERLRATDVGELRLSTAFDYAPPSGRAVLDPIEITAYGISGEGRVTVETGGDSLALSGRASLAPFSPRALLTRFDLPVPTSSDPRALGRAELAASFATTGSSGSFRDIALTLDDSRITGEFSVENFADPLYRFTLRADRIDADRYLPPKGASTPTAEGASGAKPAADAAGSGAATERRLGDIRLENEALTATRLVGSASVGELRIGGMLFEQLATDLAIGDGRAALSSVQTVLYGGNFEGGFELDTTGPTPSVHLRGIASTLGLEPLLRDMLGASYVSGTGNFDLDLTGYGATIGEATSAAAGTMTVSFRDGELRGVNLGRSLCRAVNTARQLPAPAAAPDTTPYQIISASATVAGGVATTENLYASTGYLELTGRGTIELADQTLDTSYVTRLNGPVNIAGCEGLNSRVDGSIPIGFSLKGQLPTPDIAFDISQLIEDLIRREIRNQTEDALRNRVEDALRGLLQ